MAHFKRDIYMKVLDKIMGKMRSRSCDGDTVGCSDDRTRVIHPGLLIASLDGEEATYFCACRAGQANYPCPRCLVHKSELHQITKTFEARTPEGMKSAILSARAAESKTASEKILQRHGLHDLEVRY